MDLYALLHGFYAPGPRLSSEDSAREHSVRGLRVKGAWSERILGLFGLGLAYTTVTRINSAYPAIHSVSNITSGIIAQYATDVEAEINLYVGARYTLPFTISVPILTAIATRETIYRIAVQRALVQFPPAQQGTHPLAQQHKDDQDLLKKIGEGTIALVSSDGSGVLVNLSGQLQVYSTTKNYVPTFHEGEWTSMQVDPWKLDDIDAR